MTCYQRYVIEWLSTRRMGAARLAGRWVWPEDVRNDPELAELCYHVIA